MKTEEAYMLGKDYALHGANTTNCHFSIFAREDLKTAWEAGRDATKER